MMQHTTAPNKWARWPATQCNIVCEEHEHCTELPGFKPWWLTPSCMLCCSGLTIMLFYCWSGTCLDSYSWTCSEEGQKAAWLSKCFSATPLPGQNLVLNVKWIKSRVTKDKKQNIKCPLMVRFGLLSPQNLCREWILIFRSFTALQRRNRP